MNDGPPLKPVIWVGSSLEDLREFPEPVQEHVGYALYVAQRGGKHRDTKTLSGFRGAAIVEVIKGLSRRYIARSVHRPIRGGRVCPSRFSKEIEERTGNRAP
jgi:phage-related protein